MDQTRTLGNEIEYLIGWTTETEFKGNEIHIYGNPAGLRKLAKKLVAMADIDQSNELFPTDDSAHHHYRIGCNTEAPDQHPLLTIGRVDSKDDDALLRDCFVPLNPDGGQLAIQ